MQKLLIIADRKGSGCATPRGLQLAHKLGIQADVVAFTYAPMKQLKMKANQKADVRKRLLAEREAVVQERIDRHKRDNQKVKLHVVWEKDIASWINKQCARGSYDGVLKTGQRTETIAHASTDWQLLRECQAPVLIIAEKKWHHTKPVLAALDLATTVPTKKKLNDDILTKSIGLAEALGVELEIICAISIPTLLSDLDLIDESTYVKDARENMKPAIKALARAHNLPESAFKTKKGPVDRVISSCAAKVRAQIVVLGTVGRKGVKAKLMGNTAEEVLRHLKTDILALKP